MSDPKQTRETGHPSGIRSSGMQGIDKTPGEEPARTTENPVWETQKGKNK